MAKQAKDKKVIVFKEISSYSTIFQNRPGLYRFVETLIFIVALFFVTVYVPSESALSKIIIFASAIIFLAGAPYVQKMLLSPTYVLTNNELIIQLRGKERSFSLLNVERASNWKPMYRLDGKKEALMVSRIFLEKLDDQLAKARKVKKR